MLLGTSRQWDGMGAVNCIGTRICDGLCIELQCSSSWYFASDGKKKSYFTLSLLYLLIDTSLLALVIATVAPPSCLVPTCSHHVG
uniref:Uncharacterized protein n=1 Tax=Arundo donax TaxID=35708 RepID=A0A0A9G5I8_ARUDO